MGETDLMVLGGPSPLGAQAVGKPDQGADLAEELLHHRLAARGTDDEAGAVGVVEDPEPAPAKAGVQKVFLPTRTLVSSEASTVLDSKRCLIKLVCAAKAGALSCSRLANAPSLISSPNRSRISRARRSNGMA